MSDADRKPGDEVDHLYEQLIAAGVTGMKYHKGSTGWGSSITIPRDQIVKLLTLPGWRPDEQPKIER